MTQALYPGSFDPVTLGHLDVIRRGRAWFDRLVVAVGINPEKRTVFTVDERMALLRDALREEGIDAEVASFSGLAVEFARSRGIRCILRGVRTASDFDYELTMAQMNRQLSPEVDTLFVTPLPAYAFLSGRLVREIGSFGTELKGLVPEGVRGRIERRLKEKRAHGA